MQKITITLLAVACMMSATSCQSQQSKAKDAAKETPADVTTAGDMKPVVLPEPFATKSARVFCDVIGWPAGKMPTAPQGFTVSKFAGGLDNPRWIYVGPNGDIFVSEANTKVSFKTKVEYAAVGKLKDGNYSKGANHILIFRDANHDGVPELQQVFIDGMNQPFGMVIVGNHFYVGNTDGVIMFPYTPGQTSITGPGQKILDLPAGGYNNHWTRNLVPSKDGKKIFVTVGSGSNVGEHGMANEVRRANILEINPDGTGERIYASGLRNPQGLGYAPGTNTLWVSVNERDELGDDLVPDYFTSVKDGGFYGWPFSYWGQHKDPRMKDDPRPEMVAKAIVPDVSMGAHTASLGMSFDQKGTMPGIYKGGAFIGQHGSWNRSELVGYRVAFVPFKAGKPTGDVQDFLTGFIADKEKHKVYGRPVGVTFTQDNAMLVADDAGNTIWRVTPNK